MKFRATTEEAKKALAGDPSKTFVVLLRHATMQVEYFAPIKADTQQPHLQDEIYIIASGQAVFFRANERTACKQGDVLFVPAGMEHRFESFSDDFAAWVVFYGHEGGERQCDIE